MTNTEIDQHFLEMLKIAEQSYFYIDRDQLPAGLLLGPDQGEEKIIDWDEIELGHLIATYLNDHHLFIEMFLRCIVEPFYDPKEATLESYIVLSGTFLSGAVHAALNNLSFGLNVERGNHVQ